MDRDIPAFNQLVMNKINQKNLYMHEQRLQNIRSSQNSRAYLSTSMNTRQNRKAQQIEEEKKTEIEKHNLMLFNKMKKIMNRPDPHNRPLQQNSKNYNRMSMELTKIQEENRNMYERIEKQRPTISNKKLYEERQKHLNVLKFLGKYSAHSIQNATAQNIRASQTSSRAQNTFLPDRRKAYTTKPQHYLEDTQTQINTNAQSKPRYENIEYDEEIMDDDFNRMRAIIEAKRDKRAKQIRQQKEETNIDRYEQDINEKQFRQKKKIMEERPSVPRSAKDITLYKTNKDINGNLYQIRILRKHLTYQIRCSISNSVDPPIKLEFSQQQGNQLLQQSNYDYNSIIERLKIMNNILFLANTQTDAPTVNQNVVKQQDLISQIKNKKKNPLPFINASHISEQNEEDSYQVDVKEKLPLPRNDEINDLDSLGEEEQFEKYTTEELSQSQNHLDFIHRPANFEEKLQQLKQNNQQNQEQKLEIPQKYQVQLQNDSLGPNFQDQQCQKNYEEALEQYID